MHLYGFLIVTGYLERYPPTRYITISQENSKPFWILKTSFPKAKKGITQKRKATARRKY